MVKTFKYQIGDELEIGRFPYSSGSNKIKWVLIDIDNDSGLLISKEALINMPFNDSECKTDDKVSWETSTIREWLNSEFFDQAFDKKEQDKILDTTVIAKSKSNEFHLFANEGKDTIDKIYLLSVEESKKYFTYDADRVCKPTQYAIDNNCWVDEDSQATCWWLRTVGGISPYIAYVYYDGYIWKDGCLSDFDKWGVRPVMWIML